MNWIHELVIIFRLWNGAVMYYPRCHEPYTGPCFGFRPSMDLEHRNTRIEVSAN